MDRHMAYNRQRVVNGQLIGNEETIEFSHSIATPSASKSPISVKHSVLNDNTYKLTMTISKLKQSDFGEYTCIAVNSMGQSDSSLIIDGKLLCMQLSIPYNALIKYVIISILLSC